jgi:hypothetical protein
MKIYKYVTISIYNERDVNRYLNWARSNNWNLIGYQNENFYFDFIWDGEDCETEPTAQEYEKYLKWYGML